MACLNSKKGGCGCRMAAQNVYATPASAGISYAGATGSQSCGFPYYCGTCGPIDPVNTCTAYCPAGSVPLSSYQVGPIDTNGTATAQDTGTSSSTRCCNNCGSCGNCNNCNNCSNCGNCSGCAYCGFNPAYGHFSISDALSVTAGGVLPFASGGGLVQNMSINGGVVTLAEGGVYLAILTARLQSTVPTLGATFALQLNNMAVAGGSMRVNHTMGTPSYTSVQALIQAEAGTTLSVTSSAAITIPANTALGEMMTLTLVRVS